MTRSAISAAAVLLAMLTLPNAAIPSARAATRSVTAGTDRVAAKYAIYAVFANNAYELQTDRASARRVIPIAGTSWCDVTARFSSDVTARDTGFAARVYERTDGGAVREVVVAYCGTNGKGDWLQNFGLPRLSRLVLRDGPGRTTRMERYAAWRDEQTGRQYGPALRAFERVRDAYLAQARSSDVEFVVTGHSLGGGLALHVACTFKEPTAVVFNTSPRTRTEQGTNRPAVHIFESGEILEPVRLALWTWERDFTDLAEYAYDFQRYKNPVTQHGVLILASELVRTGRKVSPELARLDLKPVERQRACLAVP